MNGGIAATYALTDRSAVASPAASRTTVDYSFRSDHDMRERYRNPWGFMRYGILMADLDALAGSVAFRHCDAHVNPMLIVTAR